MEAAAQSAQPIRRYQFGVFTVDTRSGELRKHGSRVKLQERPFQLLVALLEKPGETVSREELRQRLWSDGIFVDFDHGLSSAVNKLRGALDDSATHPRYIETVGRRGYRFLYPVSQAVPELKSRIVTFPAPAVPRIRRRWIALSLLAVLSLGVAVGIVLKTHSSAATSGSGTIHSLAVLPLKNLSSDPEQEYFSEGLTDELITRLASLDGLRVISHTSVVQYKDSRKPLPQIAKELNVDAVVEGSVLRAGGRVRITAQLIEAAADRHVWADSYERDQRDILDLQNEVTRDIAKNIKLSLDPADRQRLAISRPINAKAYDLYLKGRYFWNRRTSQSLQQAVECFQQAVTKDPNYARAYTGLADSYGLMSRYSLIPPRQVIPKARAAALRALEIDETLAEAHTSLALIVQNYDWDWQNAGKEYRRAIQLAPNYATAHHWYAEYLAYQGHFDEAFAEIEKARQLDPQSLIIPTDHGVILFFSRQYDRAIEQFRAVHDMDPNFPLAPRLPPAYVQKGSFGDALAALDELRRANDGPWTWSGLAYVYGRSGQQGPAQQELAKLEDLNRRRPLDPAPILVAYVGMGKKDQAFAWLEKCYSAHSTVLVTLKVDPTFDPLRSDPRFQDMLRRVGLTE